MRVLEPGELKPLKPRCDLCRFWERGSEVTAKDDVTGEDVLYCWIGACRFNAPVVKTSRDRVLPKWPETLSHDLCGQFKPEDL